MPLCYHQKETKTNPTMKITLDIDQLLKNGRISQEEYARLKQFSTESTASFALNIVLAFGIIAISGGTIALIHSSSVTIALGLVLAGLGGYICVAGINNWKLLGNILLPLGALTSAGGIISTTHGSIEGFSSIAFLFMFGGIAARSGLLISLSAFAILSAIGGATGYEHACYFLCIEQPLLTIVVFTVLALLAYLVSRYTAPTYSRLATIFSRSAIVIANFGFWVGSLWGDRSHISDWFFITTWAIILVAAGIFGAIRGLRWLINTAAVFGAIHLYTQWFEHFHATPGSIVIAGLFTVGVAVALISYNKREHNIAPTV